MKLRFLPAAFLLLFIIAILAGCSSSPPSPGTKTSSSGVMPWEIGTPVPYTQLSQLVLSRAEMPFVPVAWMNQTPDMSEPEFAQFGALRGYKQISINEKVESATSVQLGQLIVEYPPENAALAIRAFEFENRNADQSRYKITWFADPRIGDQSCALEVTDSSGGTKPIAMVVFTKSNIMESVVMVAPKPDIDALTRSARMAAAKIP